MCVRVVIGMLASGGDLRHLCNLSDSSAHDQIQRETTYRRVDECSSARLPGVAIALLITFTAGELGGHFEP